MHRSRSQVAEELSACIHCNECLAACPALPTPIAIKTLNRETLAGPLSPEVAQFAQACYQCGACVPVCPVGLHRDAMMLWVKMRLLRGDVGAPAAIAPDAITPARPTGGERGERFYVMARTVPRRRGSFPQPDDDSRRTATWR